MVNTSHILKQRTLLPLYLSNNCVSLLVEGAVVSFLREELEKAFGFV